MAAWALVDTGVALQATHVRRFRYVLTPTGTDRPNGAERPGCAHA